jgi:hypothetical protein
MRIISATKTTNSYVDSSEAVHILSACFRELKKGSPLLWKISIINREANPLVFAALELARFDSKLVTVFINPHDVRNDSCFTRPVFVSSCLIKAVTFTTEVHEDQSGKPNFRNMNRKLDMVQNAKGRHYRHYEPAGPALSNPVARLGNVEHMVLQGCEYGPRLRFCQGCDNLFVTILAQHPFYHLTSLKLDNIYVSGSRLRGVITKHAATLQRVKLCSVFLTDSTWRSEIVLERRQWEEVMSGTWSEKVLMYTGEVRLFVDIVLCSSSERGRHKVSLKLFLRRGEVSSISCFCSGFCKEVEV